MLILLIILNNVSLKRNIRKQEIVKFQMFKLQRNVYRLIIYRTFVNWIYELFGITEEELIYLYQNDKLSIDLNGTISSLNEQLSFQPDIRQSRGTLSSQGIRYA